MQEISPSSTILHHSPASRDVTGDLIHYYLNSVYKENSHLAPPSCPPSPVSSEPDVPVVNHSDDSHSEMSSTVSSGKTKNMSYTAGAVYLHALMLRGVDVDQKELPHPNHLQPLLSQLKDSPGDSIIPPSILNTMWIRDNAPNESTLALTLPFLVMEWLQTIADVKVATNAQWSTVPLLSVDDKTLSLPKPDLTLGIRISAIEDGKKLAPYLSTLSPSLVTRLLRSQLSQWSQSLAILSKVAFKIYTTQLSFSGTSRCYPAISLNSRLCVCSLSLSANTKSKSEPTGQLLEKQPLSTTFQRYAIIFSLGRQKTGCMQGPVLKEPSNGLTNKISLG